MHIYSACSLVQRTKKAYFENRQISRRLFIPHVHDSKLTRRKLVGNDSKARLASPNHKANLSELVLGYMEADFASDAHFAAI